MCVKMFNDLRALRVAVRRCPAETKYSQELRFLEVQVQKNP